MITRKNLELLKKQHYAIAGKHSAIQICRWTKKDLLNDGACYKSKFYGIKSYGCCEMSPSAVWCDNKCLHCWRAIENTQGNKIPSDTDSPNKIIEECVKGRKKLLTGFKGNSKVNMKKFKDAQKPSHFAISLIGEPTIYPHIGEFISELKKMRKTTFLVTNGLHPEVLKKLLAKNQLPTQLYLSLNSPNEEEYKKWHNSKIRDSWKKFNKTLSLFKKLKNKTRTVIRITLVRDLNMKKEMIGDYAKLIKKAGPLFVELKGYMNVGFSRKRLKYTDMPTFKEIEIYAEALAKDCGMVVLGKHEFSRVVLIGKSNNRKKMKIKQSI